MQKDRCSLDLRNSDEVGSSRYLSTTNLDDPNQIEIKPVQSNHLVSDISANEASSSSYSGVQHELRYSEDNHSIDPIIPDPSMKLVTDVLPIMRIIILIHSPYVIDI